MNENEWDTHVSFTPMALKISPNNKLLMLATDKNLIIFYEPGTNKRILTINNNNICGEYSNPNQGICWSNCSEFIYCISDGDEGKIKTSNDNMNQNSNFSIKILSLIDGREVGSLTGHSNKIRSIYMSTINDKMILSSASYDKSVKIWQ